MTKRRKGFLERIYQLIFHSNSFTNALEGREIYTWGIDECAVLLNATAEALELEAKQEQVKNAYSTRATLQNI